MKKYVRYIALVLVCLFMFSCNWEIGVQNAVEIFKYVKPAAEVVIDAVGDDEEVKSYEQMRAEEIRRYKEEIKAAEEIRKIEEELLNSIKEKEEEENGD